MSSDRIDQMLQECLAAYEHGLTPEECLSAFPEQRAVLEPLFRQALSLRFAFANSPREEYRERTRERLLFAAGREVTQAYSTQPDEQFVQRTRRRLVAQAGASAQEALRNVPPPRLPFWINARRRLLEAAAIQMQAPRRAFPMVLALRGGLSAAVIVLAIAVAGLAYLTAQTARPQGVSAEVAQLEVQWQEVQAALASGQPVETDVIVELTNKASNLATKLSTEPVQAPVAAQLSAIIDSQQEVVSESPAPELIQAQQQLNLAEEKVRILASRVESPTSQPGAATTSTPAATSAAPTATATARPGPTATPAPVTAGQVRIRLVPNDNTYGMNWTEVRTSNMTFRIPATWEVVNVVTDDAGIAVLDSSFLRIDGDGVIVIVNTRNAEINAVVGGGKSILLRGEGKNGEAIELEDLVEVAGELSPPLRQLLNTFELTGPVIN